MSQKSLYCTAESFIWLAIVPSLENACGMEINMQIREKKVIDTDILIIGGGTAGCYAALTIAE